MKKKTENPLLAIVFLISFVSFSQILYANKIYDFYFRSLEVEDGLSQSTVYSIIQDRQGFMWIGTQDGLNRYDGNSFKVYKKKLNDSSALVNNVVTSLMQNEDGIIWVGTANGVSLFNPVFESFSYLNIKTPEGHQIEGAVRDIQKDKYGNIWLAVFESGVYRITPQGDLKLFSLGKTSIQKTINVRKIEFDDVGNVWIASYQQGLFKLDPKTEKIEQYLVNSNISNGANNDTNDINDILFLNAETLLVGTTQKGVQSFNLQTKTFTPLLENNAEGKPLYIRQIFRSEKGDLWIGTESGVYIYNLQTQKQLNLHHIYNDPYSLSDNAVHSIYQDKEGGMWIGTFFGGVNYYIESHAHFEKYYPIKGENAVSGKSISEFCEDNQHNIWIATEDAGLNKFDPSARTFSSGYIPASNVHSLMCDENDLWIGTFSDGLYVMNLQTKQLRSYKNSINTNSLNSNNIYSIYKDFASVIWIGTMKGLHKYDKNTDSFERIYEERIDCQVNDILENYKGILWVATIGRGVFSYDKNNNKWKHYPSVVENDASGRMVNCLLQDSKNQLWIGTDGAGLCMYDPKTDTFVNNFTTQDGLPNDVIYQMVEDIQGNIWGSTNKGLFRLDIEKKAITVFTHANGLLGDQFNYKSGFRSKDNKIYFGGIKGFIAFESYNFGTNTFAPPIVINSFQINNNEVPVGSNSLLKKSIIYTDQISIPFGISTISLGFSALSYVSPNGNQYAYKLEGRDEDWAYTNELHKVTYSDLSPGKYIFKVKASNSDGLWNEEGVSLQIHIMPPFYRTVWAYLFYLLITCGLLYFVFRYYSQKSNEKNKQIMEALEARKEKELYNAKIEFFTNVTHEIRTPLSLIKSPLEEVMKHVDKKDPNWENLSIIERNTNRLLKLVNELLDFRKAESKGLELNFVEVDVVSVIKETISRFLPSVKLKGVSFEATIDGAEFYADIDAEIFTKILSNLFNNALKHSRTYIRVTFQPLPDNIRLSVANDGESIPPQFAEKIFEPFFKLDESTQGSGLGLPFAKTLIKLHNGSLYLNNEKENETAFVIEIPIHQERSIRLKDGTESTNQQDEIEENIQAMNDLITFDSKRKILLVEDNEEFLQFTYNQLKVDYHVLKAQNGIQALEVLAKENVDLIISDIMMPVMDGMALCQQIKENLKCSHIPIILLTAKTSLQSKIDGLKIGADEYIEKPYSIDYLKAKIENLLENRQKIRNTYQHSPELAFETIAHSKADEEFLNNLVNIIHTHLDEVDLDVDKLANSMNMSRATFYRKVKSISELTPNDFIRLIRLKKAAELLRQKEYRVNEIAFIVGFSSSSYFSKCFQKQFGVLPKDFDKNSK